MYKNMRSDSSTYVSQASAVNAATALNYHKRHTYALISESVRILNLPKGWHTQYAEASITIASFKRRKVIKATLDNKIFIDRVFKCGMVKCQIIECQNATDMRDKMIDLYKTMVPKTHQHAIPI